MAEIGTLVAAVALTASAISVAMRFGMRTIEESARERFNRNRPIVLPPPKITA